MNHFEKIFLLGVGITDAKEQEVLEFIYTGLKKPGKKYYIVTPNPEILVMAHNDPSYKKTLNQAELALADGIGVVIASRLLGKPIKERITGVDLVENLCKYVAEQPITVGFLGAGPGVAELASECLKQKYPDLRVGLVSKEWSDNLKTKEVDILFVAFGSPKQEVWIEKNLKDIPAQVVIGVGGAFDFISGNVRRAPKFLRQLGLEWLFRLIAQPWRIKRQFSLIKFVFLVLEQRLGILK